jgi:2-iminobutanoate/2-iminopropanoate deaminase
LVFACSRFDGVGVTCAAVSLALAGCAGTGEMTTDGGRPLVYKQGKGDAPSTISTRAGVVVKREAPERAAGTAQPAPAPAESSPAMVARAPEREAPQAAPRAPSSASSGEIAAAGDAPNRYTQAARYGDLLFVSGQIAVDLDSGVFDPTQGIEAQTRQVMENLLAILESNRLTMANVVYATVYLSRINNFAGMNRVYDSFFKGARPARVVVEVANLPRGALVEISVIAGR